MNKLFIEYLLFLPIYIMNLVTSFITNSSYLISNVTEFLMVGLAGM